MAGIQTPLLPLTRPFRNDIRLIGRPSEGFIPLSPTPTPAVPSGALPPGVESVFSEIRDYLAILVKLQTLGLGSIPRVVDVTTSPTEIIPSNQNYKAYWIVNPSEVSGFASSQTIFSSASRGVGTTNSTGITVTGAGRVSLFLNITVNAGDVGTLAIAAQSQDPLSANWASTQLDIFSGNNVVGTYYASLGPLGLDDEFRLQAVVGAQAITFSVSAVLKDGSSIPTGDTVYIGGADVNTTIGFPILAGAKEAIFLTQNTPLFGISALNTLRLKVYELQ